MVQLRMLGEAYDASTPPPDTLAVFPEMTQLMRLGEEPLRHCTPPPEEAEFPVIVHSRISGD